VDECKALPATKRLNPVSDPTVGSEDPHVIGPRGGTEICDWLDLLDQISTNLAKFERNCASSLIHPFR